MKLFLASDIHGSAEGCERMLSRFEAEQADKLILAGDILYHGPRNDLPERYAPKEVAAMLNGYTDKILCVRGNCEAEVDQMMLNFPCLADYIVLWDGDTEMFVTHGHLWDPESIPGVHSGMTVVSGHTHIWRAETIDGIRYINPGSVSLPKNGNPPTYAVYENGTFAIKTLDGEKLKSC